MLSESNWSRMPMHLVRYKAQELQGLLSPETVIGFDQV